jgi:uncharacterized repeat protein (TIGR03803 family)
MIPVRENRIKNMCKKKSVSRRLVCLMVLLGLLAGARADTFKQFFSFKVTDPEYQPSSGLLLASDGNFYGVSRYSTTPGAPGVLRGGTIYRLSPAGVLTTLYVFGTNPDDGALPEAGLMEGSDHNFYGTTSYTSLSKDVAAGRGTVFRITPGGNFTTLYTFGTAPNDGAFPRSVLVQDGQGSIYGTTVSTTVTNGVNDGSGTVFRIDAAGAFTTLYTFGTAPNDGANPMAGVIFGPDGNLYGTTRNTTYNILGASGAGTVFQLTPAGVLSTFYALDPDPGNPTYYAEAANPVGGLVLGPDGTFYGTTAYTSNSGGVGSGGGTIFELSAKGLLFVMHTFSQQDPTGYTPADGADPEATLIMGADGYLYGSTVQTTLHDRRRPSHGTIFKINPQFDFESVYIFGSNVYDGTAPSVPLVEGSDGNFYLPTGIGGNEGVGNVLELANPIKVLPIGNLGTAGTDSQATLNARVNPGGRATSVYFQYGQGVDYTQPGVTFESATAAVQIGSGITPVPASAVLDRLIPNTMYHYRVVAKSSTGTTISPGFNFETNNAGPILVANPDMVTATGPGAITINVLANDTTLSGTPAGAFELTQPLHGQVVLTYDDRITYKPDVNFANYGGTDTFTYMLDGIQMGTVTISNPFFTQAGSYVGNMPMAGGEQLTLTIARTGTFTGRLRVGTVAHLLKGRFDSDGEYVATIAGQTLNLQFPGPLAPGASVAQSTITGNYGAVPISIGHLGNYTPALPAPEFGRYTMLLPAADPADGSMPVGTGYGVVNVSMKGAVTMAGRLADGTAFSQGGKLAGSGSAGADLFPVYIRLNYRVRGLLSGTLTFVAQPGVSDFDGMLAWSKPAIAQTLYPLGITTTLTAMGARYAAPPYGFLPLDLSAYQLNAELDLDAATYPSAISRQLRITLGPNAKTDTIVVTNPDGHFFSITINAATGSFYGSFFDPYTFARPAFQGVIYQPQKLGGGYFVDGFRSGAATLTIP